MWFSLTDEIRITVSAYIGEPKRDVAKLHEDILASLEPKPATAAELMDTDWIDELGDLSCPECGSKDICAHSMDIDQLDIGLPDAPGIFMIDCLITSYESWVLDTGSGNHICNHLQGFKKRETLRKDRSNLRVGEGTMLVVEAVGSYSLSLPSGLVLELENCYYVPKMIKNVISFDLLVDQDPLIIVNLVYGKMTKQPFNKDNERANELLGIIHTDVCGPFSHVARGGYRYFITFTDDFSRYGYVYLIRHKSEAFERFKEFQNEVQNQLDRKIKFLRSDRGGEYLSQEFENYLIECGIVSQLTPTYTPQMNGVSERRNRTLLDMVRSMMCRSSLPVSFWGHALETAAHILNRVPTKSIEKTPYKIWTGKKPKLSFLKIWGCEVYVKRPTSEKLKPKSDKCFFVGYPKTTVGYYFYNPTENKVFVARNGEFLEDKFLSTENTRNDVDLHEVEEDVTLPIVEPVTQQEHVETQPETVEEVQTQDLRRSTRIRQEPDRYLGFLVSQDGGDLNEPTSYGEAVSGSESEQWQEAMKAEMQPILEILFLSILCKKNEEKRSEIESISTKIAKLCCWPRSGRIWPDPGLDLPVIFRSSCAGFPNRKTRAEISVQIFRIGNCTILRIGKHLFSESEIAFSESENRPLIWGFAPENIIFRTLCAFSELHLFRIGKQHFPNRKRVFSAPSILSQIRFGKLQFPDRISPLRAGTLAKLFPESDT
ncbi:hypothetical protein OSB04_010634 [Centaurea solstitialis]|uniref:Integrase catalytic domain-containing protein n=1 Tax=Centaurea solstitialis TaxID=347529 RepID=A0AA38T7Y1_9ASTR|nr:hypothetical protein OSB04_010634 [Centaurea solstitialis]